jgi:hypothetical protein
MERRTALKASTECTYTWKLVFQTEQSGRQANRQMNRQTDRLIGRQAGMQADIQTGRQVTGPTERRKKMGGELYQVYKRVTCFQNANYAF